MTVAERHSVAADAAPPNDVAWTPGAEQALASFLESVRLAEGEGVCDEFGTGTHAAWRLAATVYWPSPVRATRHRR